MSNMFSIKIKSKKNDIKNAPRILMFVPKYPYPVVGGLERQAHELAVSLTKTHGAKVLVLSGKVTATNKEFENVEGVLVNRFNWVECRHLRFVTLPFVLAYHLWRLKGGYDILHVHQHSPASIFAIQFARLIGKKTILKISNVGDFGIQV